MTSEATKVKSYLDLLKLICTMVVIDHDIDSGIFFSVAAMPHWARRLNMLHHIAG